MKKIKIVATFIVIVLLAICCACQGSIPEEWGMSRQEVKDTIGFDGYSMVTGDIYIISDGIANIRGFNTRSTYSFSGDDKLYRITTCVFVQKETTNYSLQKVLAETIRSFDSQYSEIKDSNKLIWEEKNTIITLQNITNTSFEVERKVKQ